MEVSVVGSSQVQICRAEFGTRGFRLCFGSSGILSRKTNHVCFEQQSTRWSGGRLQFAVKAMAVEPVLTSKPSSRSKLVGGSRLFVGLPLDVVSDCNSVNHARAIAVGLKALKLLGVEGVEMPVWWGIVEKETNGKYNWSSYLAVAEMVQKTGLKLQVSLNFHGSKQAKIPLPNWITKIGESQPDVFFADRLGKRYQECLSLAVDDLAILNWKTPIQVYQEFCESFKSTFSAYLGSTIMGISMGLGPNGELRYPSHHSPTKGASGVGEFQCYDKNMLNLLKQHAEASGHAMWGLGGPHDAPSYNEAPISNNFFKDHGGSWESPYGDFFLSWYASELASHGNRLLSLASSTFGDTGVNVYGKIPALHSWNRTRSHPSELTAGLYNTVNRDGYEAVAEIFARNSCKMILPGVDLSDKNQPQASLSSPESLTTQIRTACRKHGVEVSGENLDSSGSGGFEQIRKNFSGEDSLESFTYQRMGAHFFSPDHFPSFTEFFRSLNQPDLHSDDLPQEEMVGQTQNLSSDSNIQMQTA